MKKRNLSLLLMAGVITQMSVSCKENIPSKKEEVINPKIELKNHSNVPAFVYSMDPTKKLEIFTLISSSDTLKDSPNFVFGMQPDGAGFMKDPNGKGYLMISNHEKIQSVSRVYLDETFKPVKGEYIVDAVGGVTRLCSATLATPQEHGFGPVFLTAGESDEESLIHAIDPLGSASLKSDPNRVKPALGRASMENAVPLPNDVAGNKTLIIIGEDQGFSSKHRSAGQLLMYASDTKGDLDNGKLYALKRVNGSEKTNTVKEMHMKKGEKYDVEFVEIPNAKNSTGAEINQKNIDLEVIQFSRVEDIDYRKGAKKGNEIYFTATGQEDKSGQPIEGFTKFGRVYHLVLNPENMFTGKLEVIAEGDSNPGKDLINPDNLCVTENYVYIQEDGDSYYEEATHDSYIWQYNIATGEYKPWLNMKHERGNAQWNKKFNQSGNLDKFGSWEFGAMNDISDLIGVPGTFTVNIHSHTWRDDRFLNVDGSGTRKEKEGGQVVIIKNVER